MTAAAGPVVLGIDFGTSNTVAALAVPGRPPRVLSLDGAGWLPSAVYLDDDGRLAVGRDAERRARLAPERFEPNPKRRIDDGDLMLGTGVVPVVEAIAAVLARVGEETRRQLAGRSPDLVMLTHPAQWGSTRRAVLQTAARKAGLSNRVTLLPEPVAAAVHFASLQSAGDRPATVGRALAVYDLGGGTFDCAVVTTENQQYTVASDDGLADVGGVDFDQALLDLLGRMKSSTEPSRWRNLLRPKTSAERRAARALREDVRTAKESLSRYQQADLPLPEPFTDALVSRAEFEGLIRPMVVRTVDLLATTIERSGYTSRQLTGIYLVGGSSRIPLVGKEIGGRIGVVPITLDQPETAVALGAALWPAAQQQRGTAPYSWPPTGPRSGPSSAPVFGPRSGPVIRPASAPQPVQRIGSPANQQRPPTGPNVGSAGRDSGTSWDAAQSGRLAMPPTTRKSRRGAVLGAAAAVVVLLAAMATIVLTNRGTTAGQIPTGGTGSASSSATNTRPIDPTKCTVDNADQQGLTDCMASFAGGLVTGAECTKDAEKIGMKQADLDNFGSLAPAWTACYLADKQYVSLLFQNTNATARDASWRTTMTLLQPKNCGTFVSSDRRSRGIFVAGVFGLDGEPAIFWEDTALPLFGIFRPPGRDTTFGVQDVQSYFTQHAGFGLEAKPCSSILESTGDAGSSSAGGSSAVGSSSPVPSSSSSTDPQACAATPLDANHMSPCIKGIAGKAPEAKTLCVPDEKLMQNLLTQLENAGLTPAAFTACVFETADLAVTVIYLQFADANNRDTFFKTLSAGETSTTWSQGGRSGKSVTSTNKGTSANTGSAQVVWSVDDLPIVAFAQGTSGRGKTVADTALMAPLTAFWKSTLLPQG